MNDEKLYTLAKNQVCTFDWIQAVHEEFKEKFGCRGSNCLFDQYNKNQIKITVEYYTLKEFLNTSHHYYYVLDNCIELHAGLDQRITPRHYYSLNRNNVYQGSTYMICHDCFNTAFFDYFTNHCHNFNLSTNNCDIICGRGRSTFLIAVAFFLLYANMIYFNIANILALLLLVPCFVYFVNVHTYLLNYECTHLDIKDTCEN